MERALVARLVTALEQLAAEVGIAGEYLDADRHVRRISPETTLALLQTLGVEVRDEAAAAAALEAREREAWGRVLPPVVVAHADTGRAQVPVTLPAATQMLGWRIELEGGGTADGTASFAALPLDARSSSETHERRRLALPASLAFGYHRLRIVAPVAAEMPLIVSPGRCWLPPRLAAGEKVWGLAVQLYLLRSQRDWGIGDFTDLAELARLLARDGASVVGLNPLHAMFLDRPEHASPYSPASRLLLNVLYVDVTAVPGFERCESARELIGSPDFAARFAACRAAPLTRYDDVCELKLDVLRLVFDEQRADAASADSASFRAFRDARGAALQQACVFQALRSTFAARDPGLADWHAWPAEYRDAGGAAVARFARERQGEIDFLAWLQWVADVQLGAAADAAAAMAVGLYRDLAVGADAQGVETWSNPGAVLAGAQVGAPPDVYNPAGQGWGLPPFHPVALRDEAYRSFIELLRANMRYAGAMRIDHAMALQRLYLIPDGNAPTDGGYVAYPLEDLLGILALESLRNECLVIGEDLGTVPDGFRERMARANVLSYRVLFFETEPESHAFLPPERYPELALAVIGSHDLPTLRAWWSGSDIALKAELGLFPQPQDAQAMRDQRARDRNLLRDALACEGLLEAGTPGDAQLLRAAHAFLARTPSLVALAQIDDVVGETEPVNVPSTTDERPNWRRRQSLAIERLPASARYRAVVETFATEGRGAVREPHGVS